MQEFSCIEAIATMRSVSHLLSRMASLAASLVVKAEIRAEEEANETTEGKCVRKREGERA